MDCSWLRWALTLATGMSGAARAAAAAGAGAGPAGDSGAAGAAVARAATSAPAAVAAVAARRIKDLPVDDMGGSEFRTRTGRNERDAVWCTHPWGKGALKRCHGGAVSRWGSGTWVRSV